LGFRKTAPAWSKKELDLIKKLDYVPIAVEG